MSKVGQELNPPSEAVKAALNQAYSDEWFGHYNYYFASLMIKGFSSASLVPLLRKKSRASFDRADSLASRLIELGGEPVAKLTELPMRATDKPFKLPDDRSDGPGLLKAVLDAERTSIRTFHALLQLTQTVDPLTARLALELLEQVVRGEQQLETLLGETAPEMDGR